MKKQISFLLILCLTVLVFSGCSQKPDDKPIDVSDDPTQPETPDETKEPNPKYDLCESSEFLMFKPVVTVRDGEYEVWITTQYSGICSIVIGDESFVAADDIADDGWNFFKCRIPQEKLDKAKTYAICYAQSEDAKPKGVEFEFKPIEKTENIHVYVSSDVHEAFNATLSEYEYWGDDVDLIVCNGDFLNQISVNDDIFKIISFYGELSRGRYPLVTARGNHEYIEANRDHNRQGAEGSSKGYKSYTKYISENGKNYYKFTIGPITGIVFDLLEGGENVTFPKDEQSYIETVTRGLLEEEAFLENVELDDEKIKIVIGHCSPSYDGGVMGDEMLCFEDGILFPEYEKITGLINNLNIDFMICGHFHGNFIFEPNDGQGQVPTNYPIIFGCTRLHAFENNHSGMALTLYKDKVDVVYVDHLLNVMGTATVSYPQN